MNNSQSGMDWNETMDTSIAHRSGGLPPTFDSDKVIASAHIRDLAEIGDGIDKYRQGLYTFSKVTVVGKVINVEEEQNSVIYIVADLDDPEKILRCNMLQQCLGSENRYVEGSLVSVSGKLHYQDCKLEIIIFRMFELDEEGLIKLHSAQVRLSKLLYGRNVIEKLYTNLEMFENVPYFDIPVAASKKKYFPEAGGVDNKVEVALVEDKMSYSDKIIQYLRETGKDQFEISDLTTHFKKSQREIKEIIEAMETEGLVYPNGDNTYGLGC
uniref:RPA_C domain-containing protein n=1 Tax=Parastrongyloides trichosuri TaxID=131310 RepID=A0A0N4ZQZ3_PARTI